MSLQQLEDINATQLPQVMISRCFSEWGALHKTADGYRMDGVVVDRERLRFGRLEVNPGREAA